MKKGLYCAECGARATSRNIDHKPGCSGINAIEVDIPFDDGLDAEFSDEYPEAEIDMAKVTRMAEGHAAWFTNIIKPILVSFSIHFYKHGYDDGRDKAAKGDEN